MDWINKIIDKLGGVEYALLWVGLFCLAFLCLRFLANVYASVCKIRMQAKKRAELRKSATRRVEYTLPDKENSYLRARLHTTLREEPTEPTEKGSAAVQLRYAKQLLARLKESALSPVERLDVEEIDRLIALYYERDRWSNSESKAVNDLLARLLKLSAKYEIAV